MAVDTQGWPPESALDAGDANEDNASGIYDEGAGIRWYECQRSGMLFPSSEMEFEEITGLHVAERFADRPDPMDPRLSGVGGLRIFPGKEETTE